MVTLITRPRVATKSGQERAANRLAQVLAQNGPPQPTKETRQNYRALLRKADKRARAAARKLGVKV